MLGDGEHISHTLKCGSMDDLGTRMKFLTELYDLWLTGLDICDRYDRHTPFYHERRTELEHALKLLRFHLEKDYSDKAYRKEIDENTSASNS
jgi:hypothetical protein